MEDLFELLLPLLIFVLPVLLRKGKKDEKKKKASKPGKSPVKQPENLQQTLAEVEKKLSEWAEAFEESEEESEDIPAEVKTNAPVTASRPDMAPQRLEAKPLVAASMATDPMRELGLQEGASRADEAGCIGGSMAHDGDAHHQGMDFHPHGTHDLLRQRQDAPMQVEKVKPAVSAAELRRAVIWKEILDKPVSARE